MVQYEKFTPKADMIKCNTVHNLVNDTGVRTEYLEERAVFETGKNNRPAVKNSNCDGSNENMLYCFDSYYSAYMIWVNLDHLYRNFTRTRYFCFTCATSYTMYSLYKSAVDFTLLGFGFPIG